MTLFLVNKVLLKSKRLLNTLRSGQWLCSMLLGLLVTATAGAETLQQAWDIALDVNHGLKATRKMTVASGQQLKAAESAHLPGVSLQAGYTLLDNEPASRATLGATAVEFPIADKDSLSVKVMATLPIYTSGLINSGIDAASASLMALQSKEQSKILDLKLKIAEAFIGVLRASQGLEVSASHVNGLEAHVNDAQHMYEQGKVVRNDVLAAKVALADAHQQKSKAHNALDLARANYNYLLGRPLGQTVSLTNIQPYIYDESLEVLTSRAKIQRSELLALRSQIKALHHKAASIRAEDGPQVALSAGYNYQENQYQVHEGQWLVVLGLEWKLFDGGVVRHQASAMESQASGLEEQIKDLTNALSLQVRQAWLGVQESRNRIEVTEAAIEQANENLKATRGRFERGLSRSSEVLDAETLRIQSQSNHANARYDLVLDSLRLKRAVGEL